MRKPEIGDFIFTHNSCGIVKYIGINTVEMDNNVNIIKVSFDEITDVI